MIVDIDQTPNEKKTKIKDTKLFTSFLMRKIRDVKSNETAKQTIQIAFRKQFLDENEKLYPV